MRTLRLALAQIDVTVGDLDGNTRKIVDYIHQARGFQADLVAFPEMAIPGYPPEDLLLKPGFIHENLQRLQEVVEASEGIAVIVGFADADSDIHNAAAVAYDGRLAGVYHKIYLPNYGVFDEARYFKPGRACPVFVIGGTPVGVNICEDIWYAAGPTVAQRRAGAELIVNINGSPYHAGKRGFREKMLATRASDNGLFVAYVNMVGGQDELVFDGNSMVMGPTGEMEIQASQFEEDLLVVDLTVESVFRSRLHDPRNRTESWASDAAVATPSVVHVSDADGGGGRPPAPRADPKVYSGAAEVYHALVMGTRDYMRKCDFQKAVVALSGGIDSAMVAAVAVDALGPENVLGVAMPSRYSSEGSVTDARAVAQNLGFQLWTIPIEPEFQAYLDSLAPHFEGTAAGTTEENIQARIRGNLVMAISNKFGWMVLTTGNKSELATGYATLYGDMSGGFAVLKDVPKTLVYQLAEYRNSWGPRPAIPRSVIEKPPSAELRPDQKDEDTLPPYSVLDPILKAYVEEDRSLDEIVAMGFDEGTVQRVATLVDRSEYKRRQAPPGIKITPRNFGRDRRMPIANRYRPC